MIRKALCLALLLPLASVAARAGPAEGRRVANLGDGVQPVYSGNPLPNPGPLSFIGRIDTAGGTAYDLWFIGPTSTTIYCDSVYGLHATWMWSLGLPAVDRNMRYNFLDKTLRQWAFNQGSDFMHWGINVFDVRSGCGNVDGHPTQGTAWICAHRADSSTLQPECAQDQAPGTGSFIYCPGDPNAKGYLRPGMGLTSSGIPHFVLTEDLSQQHLYYSKIDPWCTWLTPVSWVGGSPDAGWPDYNIATSHRSRTVAAMWVNMNEYPATQPATGYVALTHDDGQTLETPIELPFPPVLNTGDTLPSWDVNSLSGIFDEQDSLHIVGNLQPWIVSAHALQWAPSQIWHFDFAHGWHLVHAAYTDTLVNPGPEADYADRPTLCQVGPHEYVCVWEQVDSLNVDPTTGENRWHILGARSTDDGVTWGDAVVLAHADSQSLRFPCIARNTFGDDTCHLMYLEDLQAGFAIGGGTQVGDPTPNPVIHQMVWSHDIAVRSAVAESRTARARMLLAVAPNPSHGVTRLSYALPQAGNVSLKVYDNMGRLVRILANGKANPGNYTAVWNGLNDDCARLSAGVYFVTLSAGNARIRRKLTLLE